MPSLPSTHASQSFGHRSVHFYAAPGQVSDPDPRARPDEHRLLDSSGEAHDLRVASPRYRLDPGDFASVLRIQAGPDRRSRPVALIHHDRKDWTRTQPGADVLLARTGVARTANWTLSMLLLAVALLAAAYMPLAAFLRELAPGAFSALPAFDIFALVLARAPEITQARLSLAAPEFAAGVEALWPPAGPYLDVAGYAAACLALGVTAYAARSWRLIWVPAFAAAAIGGAASLSDGAAAAPYAAAALTGALALFMIGGAVNSTRDAARLESRIELLALHLIANPPEEMVMVRPPAAAAPDQFVAPGDEAGAPAGDTAAEPAEAPSDASAASAETAEPDAEDTAPEETPEETAAVIALVEEALPEETAAIRARDGEPRATPDDAGAGGLAAETETDGTPAERAPAARDPRSEETAPAADDAAEAARPAARAEADARAEDRAMMLPPPPPMAAAAGYGKDNAPRRYPTQTVAPSGVFRDNVVPIFSAPPAPRRTPEPQDP